MKFLLFASILLGMFLNVHAQSPLASLLPMEGTWEGEGTARERSGEEVHFTQKEEVNILLDGKIIMYHGQGFGKESGKLEFEAVGMLYYDKNAGETFINAWTKDGEYTHADVEITADGFIWQFDVPAGGTIKYTAKISDTEWNESGEYSPDGQQWFPFMSMHLTKK